MDSSDQASLREVFARLFDANPLPNLVIDARTLQILDVNAAAMAAFGYSRNEFRALKTSDLTVPEGQAQESRLRAVRESRSPTTRFGPLNYKKKDGSIMRATATSYIVEYAGQSIRVAMLEDVTEQEKLEQQMRQAQRLESLGLLAGGIAHDFNNLLAVILNMTASLKTRLGRFESEADGGEVVRDVERIEKASQAASRLTRQLLAFARQDTTQRVVIDVGEQIASLSELLRRTLGSHVRLTTATAPDLWRVSMDPVQLEQIVINLAANARDAMPQGGMLSINAGNFTVDAAYARTRPRLKPGRYVQVRVGDSGAGMDQATLERVFEPFFTTKPVGQGTGMGLATVYGIVERLEGHISIDSEIGHGTTVTMLLPASAEEVTVEVRPQPARRVSTSLTVMLVEDFEDLRNLFVEILTAAGYRVLPAPDGAAALELARNHPGPIDLLLTDVVMPGMLGPALAAELRSERPTMRVIFMSGHAGPVLGLPATLPAGTPLIQKPFMADELLAKIAEVMG
jgi:two-component system cell cycle sensor histidine kinase/response regulator CckA